MPRCNENNDWDCELTLEEVQAVAPEAVSQWFSTVTSNKIYAQAALDLAREQDAVSYDWLQDALFSEDGVLYN